MILNRVIIFILTFLCASLVSFGQSYSNLILDKEIGQFFSELKKNTKLRIDNVDRIPIKWLEYDIIGETDTSEIFGNWGLSMFKQDSVEKYLKPDDIDYMKQQYTGQTNFKWQKADFKGFNLIDSTGVSEIFQKSKKKNRGKNNYCYSFSIPLFSKDRQFVLLRQEFLCGFLCSTQCIYLYRKSQDRKTWTEITRWMCLSS